MLPISWSQTSGSVKYSSGANWSINPSSAGPRRGRRWKIHWHVRASSSKLNGPTSNLPTSSENEESYMTILHCEVNGALKMKLIAKKSYDEIACSSAGSAGGTHKLAESDSGCASDPTGGKFGRWALRTPSRVLLAGMLEILVHSLKLPTIAICFQPAFLVSRGVFAILEESGLRLLSGSAWRRTRTSVSPVW